MPPITACGFERQSEELRVESEDKGAGASLHSPHSTLRELSATHAWTLGKREPKAKRAPSEQVYRLRY